MIAIIDYNSSYQPWFEKLNRRWIEKHFYMEEVDEYVLKNPEEAIIAAGGLILMATHNGEIAGTAALRKLSDQQYEFTKMAVDESFQRKGIAAALCDACLSRAADLGAQSIVLYSNSILIPALKLYEKLGFRYLAPDNMEYQRSDIKMMLDIRDLVLQ